MAQPPCPNAVTRVQRHEVSAGLVEDVLILVDGVGPLMVGGQLVRSGKPAAGARALPWQEWHAWPTPRLLPIGPSRR